MAFIDNMTAQDRARAYNLLAEAFSSPPTEESIRRLQDMAQALGVHCDHDFPPGNVRSEFMNLLVVPNPRYVAPYESAYRDDRLGPGAEAGGPRCAGLLMGDSTLAVRQAFVDAGVLPVRDLPDHIANELRLVGHLWHVEASVNAEQAVEAARQRRRFVAEHPLRWIRELGGTIAGRGSTGFYRAAIESAHVLLDAEAARVDHAGESSGDRSTIELPVGDGSDGHPALHEAAAHVRSERRQHSAEA